MVCLGIVLNVHMLFIEMMEFVYCYPYARLNEVIAHELKELKVCTGLIFDIWVFLLRNLNHIGFSKRFF